MEAYADNTGLMWELGAQLNALLVFAEVGASRTQRSVYQHTDGL